MNRKQIITAIRQRFARRMALNLSAVKRDDPKLVRSVYRITPYWGWKSALADAGITYDKIRVEVQESVECRLCGHRYKLLNGHLIYGHNTTPAEYLEEFPDAELCSESFREGITGRYIVSPHPEFLPHWEPIYTPEYILDRLHGYAQGDFWLDFDTLSQMDGPLIGAIRDHLKISLDDALRQIGVEPAHYRGLVRDDDFTLKDFREWLAHREQQGLDTTLGAVFSEFDLKHRRPRLVVWARRKFGNWRAALEAAGVDLAKRVYGGHPFLTRQDVLKEIRRLQRADSDMSHRAVNLTPMGSKLTSAGTRFFGNWEAALNAAHVPKKQRQRRKPYETADDVLNAICSRIENQFSLIPHDVFTGTRPDILLWKKSFELFGSWRAAVKAAGASTAQLRDADKTMFATQPKVIAELKRRIKAGQVLAKSKMSSEDSDKQLYRMAIGYFGTWQTAVRAAGQDPKQYHEWNLNPPRKYLEKKDVVAAIRLRKRNRQAINARGLTNGEHPDAPLLYAARILFGGWPEAVQAAGLSYDSVARKQQDYSAMKGRTYRRYSTRDEVVNEIKRRLKSKLPVKYRVLAHGDPNVRDNSLLIAGKKLFGGDWDNALRAAGVDLSEFHPEWVVKRKANKRKRN